MSKLSQFLKKKFGVPEINLNKTPFINVLIDDLIKQGSEVVFKGLSDGDLSILQSAVNAELIRRRRKEKPA